jgi:hypothetical protein
VVTDPALVAGLLGAMKAGARPVKPKDLGIIGREHLLKRFIAAGAQEDKAEMARLNAEPVEVPADLEKRVRDHLAENPEETWDAALRAITGLDDEDDEASDDDAEGG